eukprot:scaffold114677_cov38-Prasinocladus_malaysianus.AAC.3
MHALAEQRCKAGVVSAVEFHTGTYRTPGATFWPTAPGGTYSYEYVRAWPVVFGRTSRGAEGYGTRTHTSTRTSTGRASSSDVTQWYEYG